MTLFPTQYSTLSSHALGTYLAEAYGFSDVRCSLLLRGVSDTYRVEHAGGKAIFKIYRDAHRSLPEIQGEVELLNRLRAGGAHVSYPIPDLKGQAIQSFQAAEGIRNGVLFTYANGENVYDFSDEQLRIIGHEMAFNHTITSQLELRHPRKPYDLETTLDRPLEVIRPFFEHFPEGYAYLEETAQRVKDELERFDTTTFSTGYCHYDYLPKNFHFDEQNTLTVFDYDFAGKGFLANDLMSFQIHFFFHTFFKKISREEADRQFGVFVNAYREKKAFSEQELQAIPYLGFAFWLFYLGFQCENFEDWSNTFFSSRYIHDRINLIQQYMNLYSTF
ncbi:hypothetical protein BWI93_22720 [Siphonobacter sp. BAB-5385]|uniref:phosphotransferase enzyme family protein n=1 Tax=Siphonobacter sp. BAB-5385 TaxID=1864822 RepID=UPI000B9E4CC4|nr:phosphotransferase [Siphonobacter sp. BAB-5385]OZI05959.1 hypothetical protein BWI93_22720 [Siphonobacter sp. BAB-5385]